jgi:hypothetical protein
MPSSLQFAKRRGNEIPRLPGFAAAGEVKSPNRSRSDSIPFAKNESESCKSAQCKS